MAEMAGKLIESHFGVCRTPSAGDRLMSASEFEAPGAKPVS